MSILNLGGAATDRPEPAEMTQPSQREVRIVWKDGHESVYTGDALRLACPCASCIDELSGRRRLREESISKDVHPLAMDPTGRYAIRFDWSDGHSTGIYTYEYLRALCPCPICTGTRQTHEERTTTVQPREIRILSERSPVVYPEFFIAPMREELTRLGVRELRTAAEVDEALTKTPGTVMVVVNSVCGCAAGKARPGVALALQHPVRPDLVTTVFAGADSEATERARSYVAGYPPSSPSIAILRDGKLLYMMERHQIENQTAETIAQQLTAVFERHCAKESVAR